ncbi:hypothetical protein DFQ28_002542, partial [Apophysomyces sp. BC1034]
AAGIIAAGTPAGRTTYTTTVTFQDAQEALREAYQWALEGIIYKELKNEKDDQEISEEIKRITRCPRGAVPRAAYIYTEQHNRAVTDTDILRTLKRDFDYGKLWEMFVDDALEDTFIKVKEQLELEKQDGEEDESDDDAGEEENQKKQKIKLRTCSIPLEHILRKDLTDEGKTLFKNCVRESAVEITQDMSELSAIALGAILGVVSRGFDLSQTKTELRAKQDIGGCKLKKLFPESFAFRDDNVVDDQGYVAVQPLCVGIEKVLVEAHKKRQHGDLHDLFSQAHLQFLRSFHITDTCRSTKDHPLWAELSKLIPWDAGVCNNKNTKTAMKQTAIRQLSVNMKNMWSVTIYKKTLEYICRILLRIHLAPNREKKYTDIKSKCKNLKKEMKEKKSRESRFHFDNKSWKRDMKSTMQRLAFTLENCSADSLDEQKNKAMLLYLHRVFMLHKKKNTRLDNKALVDNDVVQGQSATDIDSVEHTLVTEDSFSFIGYEGLDEGELAEVLEITEEND